MTLNFPNYKEIPLEKSPINEVICQIRFPKNLLITSESPIKLQSLLQKKFPIYNDEQGITISEEKTQTTQKFGYNHKFLSKDETQTFTLTQDFLALSTNKYSSWNEFLSIFTFCFDQFNNCYTIPFTTRIGLRFINKLDFLDYKLGSFDDLLKVIKPELTAMDMPNGISAPTTSIHRVIFTNEAQEQLSIQYGKLLFEESTSPSFMLDYDYSTEDKKNLTDVNLILNDFHKKLYNVFRWSITEELISLFGRKK